MCAGAERRGPPPREPRPAVSRESAHRSAKRRGFRVSAVQDPPLVSVIVPTFNAEATLAVALRSLAEQTERDFEVVLSDGASRDATLRIAEATAPALPTCRLLSRPDRGVYDAINLGIAAARGHWVLILGSDDRLHAPDTLAQVAAALRESLAAIVYGDVRVMHTSGLGVPAGGRYAGAMPLARLMRGNICQQAIFYRRRLFEELGSFDLRYPVLADWEFNLRAAFHAPMQWVDIVVADYAATGLSARQEDPAAALGFAELIRSELIRQRGDRSLWPMQRVLLRQADAFRRRGQWREAFRQVGSYLWLQGARGMHLFG